MSNYFLIMLVGCCIVTWIPRVVPFVISKKMVFPNWLERFLSYLPLCILTALLLQSVLDYREGAFPGLKGLEFLACLPTLIVAMRTKDLMKTVIVGIVTIALLRFIL
ncbi:AzlD domain-containing protein [Enterococcus sp. LJL90]